LTVSKEHLISLLQPLSLSLYIQAPLHRPRAVSAWLVTWGLGRGRWRWRGLSIVNWRTMATHSVVSVVHSPGKRAVIPVMTPTTARFSCGALGNPCPLLSLSLHGSTNQSIIQVMRRRLCTFCLVWDLAFSWAYVSLIPCVCISLTSLARFVWPHMKRR
jgi:hypothetical protein